MCRSETAEPSAFLETSFSLPGNKAFIPSSDRPLCSFLGLLATITQIDCLPAFWVLAQIVPPRSSGQQPSVCKPLIFTLNRMCRLTFFSMDFCIQQQFIKYLSSGSSKKCKRGGPNPPLDSLYCNCNTPRCSGSGVSSRRTGDLEVGLGEAHGSVRSQSKSDVTPPTQEVDGFHLEKVLLVSPSDAAFEQIKGLTLKQKLNRRLPERKTLSMSKKRPLIVV